MSDSPFAALAAYGWTDRVLALFSSLDIASPALLPARVVRVERSLVAVVDGAGRDRLIHPSEPLAVGDWIALDGDAVRHVLPHWSSLARLGPEGGHQVLAVNVDLVFITTPADRSNANRVERELALAWEAGAMPVVVVTKTDIGGGVAADLAGRLLGVDVFGVSAVSGAGLGEVRRLLAPDRTAVLLGPSGAGKSTLTNALVDAAVQSTGEVRGGDARGRHTTSSRQLFPVPSGGVIIDTPGLRSLGLTAGADLEAVFPEIDEMSAGCRFSDCSHDAEPGCAVKAALESGDLDPARWASYRKLQREVAVEARRTDPLARQAQLKMWKARTKEYRLQSKGRGGR